MASQILKVTPDAQADLKSIARYTYRQWGKKQSQNYSKKLAACFNRIKRKAVVLKTLGQFKPTIFITKCEHHYILFTETTEKISVLAILHEKMDMMEHLKSRLKP